MGTKEQKPKKRTNGGGGEEAWGKGRRGNVSERTSGMNQCEAKIRSAWIRSCDCRWGIEIKRSN